MKLRHKLLTLPLLLLSAALLALALSLSYTKPHQAAPKLAPGVDSMKAVVYHNYGSVDVLEVIDVEMPVAGPQEILVKVEAASVNPLDWHFMRGSPYIMRLQSGLGAPADPRFGRDFAGTVEAVGDQVTEFEVGDRVYGGANGAFAQYLTRRATGAVAKIPDNVSAEQAASVPVAGITALQALRDKGQLQSGQSVLINGASGGVGTFAVQIAKSMGAEVTGVCSTRNVEMVKSLGADHVFDYKRENYTDSGRQYDVIIDNVGNHSLTANRRALKPNGKLVMIGGPKGDWFGPLAGPLKAMLLQPFVDQQLITIMAQMNGEDLSTLAGMISDGRITPVIEHSYPLSETAAAIRKSEEGHVRGKLLLAAQ
jgi:NADPH:quinone reductase-like Zn-dependent oxidoreductase